MRASSPRRRKEARWINALHVYPTPPVCNLKSPPLGRRRFAQAPSRSVALKLTPHTYQNWSLSMTEVKSGDTVHIHYTGTLTDGTVFDSSDGRDPLKFEVGSGQIIPGLDTAMPGMTVGEKKVVEVSADQAYGPVDPNARQQVPREGIPADIPLDLGTQLQVQTENGEVMPVTVLEVTEEHVTLDANHALAGKDLTFDIELVAIA